MRPTVVVLIGLMAVAPARAEARLSVVASPANSKSLAHFGSVGKVGKSAHKQSCGDIIARFLPFLGVHMGGIIMKTITLAVTTMLLLAAITMTAMPQSQTAYEKKSYNYAEWAKGRFAEVVTVRNAGSSIWAASDRKMKTALRAAPYCTSAISARSAAMPGTKSSGYWKSMEPP